MNELIIKSKETITSLELVDLINRLRKEEGNYTELSHNTLLRNIREEIGLKFIVQSSYINSQNKKQPMYILTLKQALRLLTKESRYVRGKVFEYIEKLEKQNEQLKLMLLNRSNSEWLLTRQQGKLTRRSETDRIAELIPYARSQGSKNADKLYIVYSKLTNKLVGIESGMRETIDVETLLYIRKLEDLFSKIMIESMKNKMYYKDIYKECKKLGSQLLKYLTLDIKALRA
ncbi:transcriptional regulator [Leptotrichia sp. OH3620_COT-345]|uniref:transcriptional regulator n=1 Tax=Leptotrichia sp. OH3620_COT-345 TaxID=2491048 RepID=UPI000F6527FF|nr:transcriptional regulator [Leptotrichia sp. OH3620_COT-345]RRD39289.1 transcriptional regulator [Leptotrichia sp. OH3620_COT-345]